MSLTTRLCPNRPDNSWGTTTVVAIPMPFSSEPYKVLTGQTPFARKSSGVKSENLLVYPLLYAPAGRRSNQNINTKESGGPISGISGLGKWRFGEPTAFVLRWHHFTGVIVEGHLFGGIPSRTGKLLHVTTRWTGEPLGTGAGARTRCAERGAGGAGMGRVAVESRPER